MKDRFSLDKGEGKEKLELMGLELIKIVNDVCYTAISTAGQNKQIAEKNVDAITEKMAQVGISHNINVPQDWLFKTSVLYDNAQKLVKKTQVDFNESSVKIKNANYSITIDKAFDRIVKFPNNAGSYQEITNRLKTILATLSPVPGKNNHQVLAEVLLLRLQVQDYPTALKSEEIFLDSLLVLLFCVESSRHFPAMLYGIMLLDMIAYGDTEKYNWNTAFVSGENYCWDNFGNTGYGGKYPMAILSSGSGNFGNFISAMGANTQRAVPQTTSDAFRYRQQNAMMVRGASLIVHWLNNLGNRAGEFLARPSAVTQLESGIKSLLRKRLSQVFNHVTVDRVPDITFKAQPYTQKNPPIVVDANTYVQIQHEKRAQKKEHNVYHQAVKSKNDVVTISCKLVPEHAKYSGYKFSSTDCNGKFEEKANLVYVDPTQNKSLVLCTWCVKHAKKADANSKNDNVSASGASNNNANITKEKGKKL